MVGYSHRSGVILTDLFYAPILAIKINVKVQSNLVIRNGLIRNKLVLRNHFPQPIGTLLHKDKEHLDLRNNSRVT